MKKVEKFKVLFILTALTLLSSHTVLERREYKLKTVVIDAGHGGKDPGTHGRSGQESLVALDVALKLGSKIQANFPDVKVIYTRKNDTFVELHDRAGLANKNGADLFISIHCNANPNSSVQGTETYTMGQHKSEDNLDVAKRENSVIVKEDGYEENYGGFDPKSPMAHILLANFQSAFLENSLRFAQKVEDNVRINTGRRSRGVKQAGFLVLWQTSMPSVLFEIGFLSNPEEEKFLLNKENQDKIAYGIYKAFKDYKEDIDDRN